MRRLGCCVAGLILLSASAAGQAQLSPGAAAIPTRCHDARNPMFAHMSETGCLTMSAAMTAAMHGVDTRGTKTEIAAARDRLLAVLDAERLDPAALQRAMDDERAAVAVQQAQQARRRAAMLTGFEQLSLADRRAFVADARALRDRVEARAAAEQQGRIRAAAGVN